MAHDKIINFLRGLIIGYIVGSCVSAYLFCSPVSKIEGQPGQSTPLSVYYPLEAPKIALGEVLGRQMVVANQIREIARQEGFVEKELLVKLAFCESSLNPTAKGDNGDSLGLFQINSRWHDLPDEERMDIKKSTLWTIDQIEQGNLNIWTCGRKIK